MNKLKLILLFFVYNNCIVAIPKPDDCLNKHSSKLFSDPPDPNIIKTVNITEPFNDTNMTVSELISNLTAMTHKAFDNYPVNGTNYTLLEIDMHWDMNLTTMPLAMNLTSVLGEGGLGPGLQIIFRSPKSFPNYPILTLQTQYFPDYKKQNLSIAGQMTCHTELWCEDLYIDVPNITLTSFETAFALQKTRRDALHKEFPQWFGGIEFSNFRQPLGEARDTSTEAIWIFGGSNYSLLMVGQHSQNVCTTFITNYNVPVGYKKTNPSCDAYFKTKPSTPSSNYGCCYEKNNTKITSGRLFKNNDKTKLIEEYFLSKKQSIQQQQQWGIYQM